MTVSVKWFHCGLSASIAGRFGAYPPHEDGDVSRELRKAADEWDRYRKWDCPSGAALLLQVDPSRFVSFGDALRHAIRSVMGIKYMEIDSVGYDVLDENGKREEDGSQTKTA